MSPSGTAMKKTVALLLSAVCIFAACASVLIFAEGNTPNSGSGEDITIKAAQMPRVEGRADIFVCFDFYIPKAAVEYLEENATDVSIYAKLVEYNEGDEAPSADSLASLKIELAKGELAVLDGTEVYVYTVKSAKINLDNCDTPIAVRGFVDYTVNGSERSVASAFTSAKNVYTPYNVIYNAYCNKTYAKDTDAEALKRLLSSKLIVRISNGKALDMLENKNYKSLYTVEYFDGVLTVSMDGADDIPESLLRSIYINEEKRYFEIHGGKVKLVV